MARRAHVAESSGIASHDRDFSRRRILAKATRVFRSRLSRRGRLHGSRELGDRFGRGFGIRLHAAEHHSAFEFDGDPVASAVRAARHCHPTRSRAGLPRSLFSAGFARALGYLRIGDLRLRFGRSDRFGHRVEFAFQNSPRLRRLHHGTRRPRRALSAKQRLSLHRGARSHADFNNRRLFSFRSYFFQAGISGRAGRFCSALRNL